jgi:hypothetical protein
MALRAGPSKLQLLMFLRIEPEDKSQVRISP